VAGDLASFDAEEFREQLAKTLEVKNVSDIVLEVQSASVNIDALVVVPTYSEAQTATSILNEFVDDPDKGTGVLGFPLESVKPVQVETGCLICIPPSPSAPPPLAPPPPPDWPLISLALGLGIIGLCIIACVCWYYAIPKIISPKLRKKKEVEINADLVNAFIEGGQAQPAEDLDPELEMNPVAVENLKRAKQKEMEKKRRAAKAKKEAAKKGKGVAPALRRFSQSSGFIVAGAFAKLGITITGKPGEEQRRAEASRDPKKVDLRAIDLEIEKATEKLNKQEAEELAAANAARAAEQAGQPSTRPPPGKKKAGGALGKLGLSRNAGDEPSVGRIGIRRPRPGKEKATPRDLGSTSSSGATGPDFA